MWRIIATKATTVDDDDDVGVNVSIGVSTAAMSLTLVVENRCKARNTLYKICGLSLFFDDVQEMGSTVVVPVSVGVQFDYCSHWRWCDEVPSLSIR